jgi:2',3'-cyclic-nucleotide 2'-phosphodiesterase (5'-nucleotidase family)
MVRSLALLLPALAAAQAQGIDLVVAATTDVHGRLRGWDYYADTVEAARGLSRAATIVDSLRLAHPGSVILVDAGDFLQGNPLAYVAARLDTVEQNPIVAAMNAMRYDAVALGNHEFNYGLGTLTRALSEARFPVLAANARRPDGSRAWPAWVMVERGGVRVAVVGATNPGAMVWDRDHLVGRLDVGDIVPAVGAAVDSVRSAGADVVIVVAHAGLDGASSYDTAATGRPSENPIARLAREVSGIDLIVFGHSHREVADTVIGGVLLVQPRNWATSVAVAHLRLDRQQGRWRVTTKHGAIVRAANHAEATGVVAAAERGHAAARRYVSTVVGRTAVTWRADSARAVDSPITDFVGEVMRRATHADLSSTASFTPEARIPAGSITVAQLAQLYPYDNTIRVLRVSGAQLKAYLEHSARYFRVTGSGSSARVAPDPAIPAYHYEMVTGADYVIDLSRPIGERVRGLHARGRAVTPGDSFDIALSNYRAGGGGGYAMLHGAPLVSDDQREVRQLLIDEVTRQGVLDPAAYFTANWRLAPPELAARAVEAVKQAEEFERRSPVAGRQSPGRATTIRVISTNDFHGAFEPRPDGAAGLRGGAPHLAAMIRRAEAECTGTCASLLVDGGDLFQGTPASNLAFGRPVVALYNTLGYAAAAVGNHEFDWGQDTLRARIREMRFGMLSANTRRADGRAPPWLRADTIVTRGGVRIGIIGITTVGTPRTTMPRNVADLRFLEAAPVVDERARSLRARGAELVIVIAHVGATCSGSTCSGELITMAQRITERVDAIIGGHTHTMTDTEVRGIPIVQGRSSGRAITVTDLPVGGGAPRRQIWEVRTDSITPDRQVDSLVRAALAEVAPLVSRPIVTVAEDLRRGALGNLIADAQREAARADIAVMNNGGVRADLREGVATYGSLYEVQPFGNLLVRVTVPGRGVRAYFERIVGRPVPGVFVSGAVIRYDPTRAAGSRITSFIVGGAPLDGAKTYTVAMSDFMATGGDGLALDELALRQEDLGIVDLDALIAFVRRIPGGVVRGDTAPRLVVERR